MTDWSFAAPIEQVWELITDIRRLPEWWPGFENANVRGNDRTLRPGQIVDCVLRAPMGYTLRFALEITDVAAPTRMRLASTGDLVGWGQWDLRPAGSRTAVTYTWHVALTRPVLAALSRFPPVRAFLSRNHDLVMKQGYAGLDRLLRAELPPPGGA